MGGGHNPLTLPRHWIRHCFNAYSFRQCRPDDRRPPAAQTGDLSSEKRLCRHRTASSEASTTTVSIHPQNIAQKSRINAQFERGTRTRRFGPAYLPGFISALSRNHTILDAGLEFRATHSTVNSWFSRTSNSESDD